LTARLADAAGVATGVVAGVVAGASNSVSSSEAPMLTLPSGDSTVTLKP